MYALYRTVTELAAPLAPWLLKRRLKRGKEDVERIGERLGRAGRARPAGMLVWIHAASIGEANAVLPLIKAIRALSAPPELLLTTVTVTSAALMAGRLPEGVIHQFAPVDTPGAVRQFIRHWRPDIALWVDSELWPNLIARTYKSGAVLGLINARLSERSLRRWQRYAPMLARQILGCFTLCVAQTAADGERLKTLGLPSVTHVANLKYDAAALPVDEEVLAALSCAAGARPIWLAACTHPGEEAIVAQVHRSVKIAHPTLLTVLVPRHASRGDAIRKELAALKIAQRSKTEPIAPETDIYLADTVGELGLFYRLSPITFIGGTLVPHGGQNPLESARLGSAVIVGPHMENFPEILQGLERDRAVLHAQDTGDLTAIVLRLLSHEEARGRLAAAGMAHVAAQSGAVQLIMKELQPYLSRVKS